MENLANLHIKNSSNVGDEYCAPAHYFPIKARYGITTRPREKSIIYGGGAIAKSVQKYNSRYKPKKSFLWGVGNTDRDINKKPESLDVYKDFILSGIRDYNVVKESTNKKNIIWVPCSSCMSPLFDNIPAPEKEVVFYGHKRMSPMQEMNNDNMDFKKVIEHLGRGETVVTSSYHGVYWATLLNRKVVCIPFGSKFFGFKHPPTIVEKYNGQKGRNYPYALEECRKKNIDFWEKIKCAI